MSDFDEIKAVEKQLEWIKRDGRWLQVGMILTVFLVVSLIWVLLIVKWPVVFGIISVIIGMPFLIGGLLRWRLASKLKTLDKRLNTKDDAVEI